HQTHFRVGLSVGKKIGNAVMRNQIKRYLREAFISLEDKINPDLDIIIIARNPTINMDYHQIKRSLSHLLHKENLFIHEKRIVFLCKEEIILRKKYILILSLIGLVLLLSGCTEINTPIDSESTGFWNSYFVYPMSWVITYFADLFNSSYGLAIVVVTLLVRIVLVPLNVKQIKSSQ